MEPLSFVAYAFYNVQEWFVLKNFGQETCHHISWTHHNHSGRGGKSHFGYGYCCDGDTFSYSLSSQ